MPPVFVDANIPMYAYGRDHPHRGPCQEALRRIVAENLEAVSSCEVVQEILHRYLALRQPALARQFATKFLAVIPEVLPITKDDISLALQLCAVYPTLPARDLLHVAVMTNNGIHEILSVDNHFDTVAEVRRVAPETFVV